MTRLTKPEPLRRLSVIIALCAAPALADGPLIGNQCDTPFIMPEYPGAPDDVVAAWAEVGLRAWKDACEPRLTMFSDAEKLAFLLSGHDVPTAPIPLAPAGSLLLVALCALYFWRKK